MVEKEKILGEERRKAGGGGDGMGMGAV